MPNILVISAFMPLLLIVTKGNLLCSCPFIYEHTLNVCEHDISQAACRNFLTFTLQVLAMGDKGQKVKAKLMTRPNNGKKLPVEHPQSGMYYNFIRFCLSLRLSVCQIITFDSLDL